MKKLSIAFLFLLSPTLGFSQTAFPFPTANAQWVEFWASPILGPDDHFLVFRNFLQGDSVFGGKTYTKVYKQKLCECICSTSINLPPASDTTPILVGGVREEADRVFFTKFGAGNGQQYFNPVTDTLLFDFTAQPGDTISYVGTSKLIFTAVDSTPEGRKRLRYNVYPTVYYGENRTWIAGIGSPFGLFRSSASLFGIGTFCNDVATPFDCPIPCDLSVSAPEAIAQPIVPTVVPSPARDAVRVTGNTDTPFDLGIYSADGRLLARHHAVRDGETIAIGRFPAGTLIFRFEFPSGKTMPVRVVRLP